MGGLLTQVIRTDPALGGAIAAVCGLAVLSTGSHGRLVGDRLYWIRVGVHVLLSMALISLFLSFVTGKAY